jgi:predicted Fe-Mo cluster-binding NifX family protein
MKIAVPTRDGHIDDHFGHCAYYTIFEVEDGKIISTSRLDSPEGCGCKSGIAADLQKIGVEVMLAGNMGDGALNKLSSHGIRVIRGCRGDINTVIHSFLAGFILDSGVGCSHHECGEH